jgi:hypothetical protein
MGKPKTDPKVAKSVMLKAGLKPLVPYSNSQIKWKCLHIECGQIVYPRYIDIKKGQGGCKECGLKNGAAKRRLSDAQLQKVLAKANLQTLEPYKNKDAKWKCKCLTCNRIVYPHYAQLRDGWGGCAYCSSRKVDESDAIEIMLTAKLKPLEPYKNSPSKWKCKCLVCNKIVFPSYNSIKMGQGGCKFCAGNIFDPAKAKRIFLKAKLKPLEPYKGANKKWKSQCMKCGEVVSPRFMNVTRGHSGCLNCSNIGFKPKQPAVLYLITHHQMNSVKVGITNTTSIISRLEQFQRYGWKIHKKYHFEKGIHAAKIEDEIMQWLKKERKLKNHLTAKDMPITGGHTETFNMDTISVIEIQKRIDGIKRASVKT